MTGWDFHTLLNQPNTLLDEFLVYQNMKAAVQAEKRQADEQRSKMK